MSSTLRLDTPRIKFNRKVEWRGTYVRIERTDARRTYSKAEMTTASWLRLHRLVVARPGLFVGGKHMIAHFGYGNHR